MKRLKPIRHAPVETPQCSVSFDESVYGKSYLKRREQRCIDKGWDVEKCNKPSSYELDGKFYCTQHAGQVALRMLTESGE
jgi:hypothetical protein